MNFVPDNPFFLHRVLPNLIQFLIFRLRRTRNQKNQEIYIRILLPTGIGENPGDSNICVENKNTLQLTVMWPYSMICVLKFMRRWLCGQDGPLIERNHLQVQGFFNFTEKFQAQGGDPIYSTARIFCLSL